MFTRLTIGLMGLCVLAILSATTDAQEEVNPSSEPNALYYSCASCHGDKGEGNRALLAPKLAGLESWYVSRQLEKFKSGERGTHPQDTYGKHMTLLARTLYGKNDIAIVSDYITTLPAPLPDNTLSGDIKSGRVLFEDNCLTCHGEDATGMKDVDAPSLITLDDWYMQNQLVKFRAGIRGNHENDFEGQQMVIMMEGITDKNIKDVIAYIQTLRIQP